MESGKSVFAASFINQSFEPPLKQSSTSSASFSDVFHQALKEVEKDLKDAEELSKLASIGEVKDLHQVMIAMEKANVSVQLAVQVRNKVVEAYQEIMRMQL